MSKKHLIFIILSYFLLTPSLWAFHVYRSKIKSNESHSSYPTYYRIPLQDVRNNLIFYVSLDSKESWNRVLHNKNHKLWALAKEIYSGYTAFGDYSGTEFLHLFTNKQKHTLIITSKAMIIAEIIPNDKKFYWHSKHIVAAGIAKHVRFAGELWRDGSRLFIDNNSGTYKPESRLVPLIANYLEQKLGISVIPVAHQPVF